MKYVLCETNYFRNVSEMNEATEQKLLLSLQASASQLHLQPLVITGQVVLPFFQANQGGNVDSTCVLHRHYELYVQNFFCSVQNTCEKFLKSQLFNFTEIHISYQDQ